MCGIVGYVGKRDATHFLLSGLQLLEYRGYDSAGLVLFTDKDTTRLRSVGYVAALKKLVETQGAKGHTGIAHTRWATHGAPHETNAHPHTDTENTFYVVHNGIIENHLALRDVLGGQQVYTSQTDTEVIAHLLAKKFKESPSIESAFLATLSLLEGSYALAVVSVHEPGKIYFARKSSPLLIGRGNDSMMIASDAAPLYGNASRVVYISDGQRGYITDSEIVLYNQENQRITCSEEQIPGSADIADKGTYEHYMLKEISEAPTVIQAALQGRFHAGFEKPNFDELDVFPAWSACKHLRIIACGTSYHAALYGKFIMEQITSVHVTVEIASEFRYSSYVPHDNEVVLAISQSGETADTRAAVLLAKDRGVPTIGIVNVPHSTIAREVDTCILLRAGLERSVASTKACVSQSVVCALLALTRCVDSEKTKELSGALLSLSSHATALLASFDGLDERIKPIANAGNVFCLGRGGNYGVALEAALKLKEVAYIHAEGYPGGELKHGSLALIDGTVPTLAFLSIHPVLREKLLSNISEVIARGGEVIAVSAYAEDVTTIQVPQSSMLVESIIHTIAAHYITYRVGVIRGTPIDKPRNLAKAVTVE